MVVVIELEIMFVDVIDAVALPSVLLVVVLEIALVLLTISELVEDDVMYVELLTADVGLRTPELVVESSKPVEVEVVIAFDKVVD